MLTTPNKTHLLSVLFFALLAWHGSAMAECILDANGNNQTSNNFSADGLSSLSSGGQQSYALALCAVLATQDSYKCVDGANGTVWLDRNLGASQVCGSSNDGACYGDFYQWGRNTDGHEKRNSPSSSTPVSYNIDNNIFITVDAEWTTDDTNGLLRKARWAKTDGSGVCPTGFRVPTVSELTAERETWQSKNAAGAFGSPLKWATAGARLAQDPSTFDTNGYIWANDISNNNTSSRILNFDFDSASIIDSTRGVGRSVRCIQGV